MQARPAVACQAAISSLPIKKSHRFFKKSGTAPSIINKHHFVYLPDKLGTNCGKSIKLIDFIQDFFSHIENGLKEPVPLSRFAQL